MPFLAFICCIVLLATTFSLPIFAFDLNDDCDGGLYYYQAIPRSGSESSSDQCRISGGTIPGFTSCDDGGYCADGYLCGPTDCTPNVTSTSSSIEPLVTCPELNGYYACPTSLGDGCCPGEFVCDEAVDCRLTLKLSFSTQVITSTEMSGSVPVSTHTITSLKVIGNGVTAADRIARATANNSTSSSDTAGPTSDTGPAETGRNDNNLDIPSSTNGPGLTTGHIIGMAIGIVCFLALSVIAFYLFLRHRRRQRGAGGLEDTADGSAAYATAELEGKDTHLDTQLSKPQIKPDMDASELPVFDVPHELDGPGPVRQVYELESEPTTQLRGN